MSKKVKLNKTVQDKIVKIMCELDVPKKGKKEFNAGRARRALSLALESVEILLLEEAMIKYFTKTMSCR